MPHSAAASTSKMIANSGVRGSVGISLAIGGSDMPGPWAAGSVGCRLGSNLYPELVKTATPLGPPRNAATQRRRDTLRRRWTWPLPRMPDFELDGWQLLDLSESGEDVALRSVVIYQAPVFVGDPGVVRMARLPFAAEDHSA